MCSQILSVEVNVVHLLFPDTSDHITISYILIFPLSLELCSLSISADCTPPKMDIAAPITQ